MRVCLWLTFSFFNGNRLSRTARLDSASRMMKALRLRRLAAADGRRLLDMESLLNGQSLPSGERGLVVEDAVCLLVEVFLFSANTLCISTLET